jgi:hypothetical protein
MTELHDLYLNSRQEKRDFLNHIIPLVLADARVGTWRDRAEHAKHWQAEFQAMEHPREVLRPAVAANAYAFVLAHNHPSGNPNTSLYQGRMLVIQNLAANDRPPAS